MTKFANLTRDVPILTRFQNLKEKKGTDFNKRNLSSNCTLRKKDSESKHAKVINPYSPTKTSNNVHQTNQSGLS